MGLLDEAIREHLDLRRRHGADPEEVAQEELDALAPVEHDERPQRWSMSTGAAVNDDVPHEDGAAGPFDGRREPLAGATAESASGPSGFRGASFMEETAEIDMRTVLGELEDAMSGEEADGDTHVRRAPRAENVAPVAAGGPRLVFDSEIDEELAWEMPAPRGRRVAGGRTAREGPSQGAFGS